jgi:hypothetical protein
MLNRRPLGQEHCQGSVLWIAICSLLRHWRFIRLGGRAGGRGSIDTCARPHYRGLVVHLAFAPRGTAWGWTVFRGLKRILHDRQLKNKILLLKAFHGETLVFMTLYCRGSGSSSHRRSLSWYRLLLLLPLLSMKLLL